MLTCKEASRLASKAVDAKLTWRERMGFSLHLTFCGLCNRYFRELKKMRTMLRKMELANKVLPKTVKLSLQSRERIKNALHKAAESDH